MNWWWPWKKPAAPVSYKDALVELLAEFARPSGEKPSRDWTRKYVTRGEDPMQRVWDESIDANPMLALLGIVGANPEVVTRSKGRLALVLGDEIYPFEIEPIPVDLAEDDPRRVASVRLRCVEAADMLRRIVPTPPTLTLVLERLAKRAKAIALAKERAAAAAKQAE